MTTTRDRRVYDERKVNGDFHVSRMRKIAAHLPAVVDAVDREGFRALVYKAQRDEDLYALIAMLAWSADLNRLAEVTGCDVPPRRNEGKDAPTAEGCAA